MANERRSSEGTLKVLQSKNKYLKPVELWLLNGCPNRNGWAYTNMRGNKNQFCGTPILTAYVNNGKTCGDGHNFSMIKDPKTGEEVPTFTAATAERIIGAMSENPDDMRLETVDGVEWIVGKGAIWTWYAREAAEKITSLAAAGKPMSISIETLVTDSEMVDGIEVEKSYEILGTTVLGDGIAPAVENARIMNLSEIASDFKQLKLRAASYIENEDGCNGEKGCGCGECGDNECDNECDKSCGCGNDNGCGQDCGCDGKSCEFEKACGCGSKECGCGGKGCSKCKDCERMKDCGCGKTCKDCECGNDNECESECNKDCECGNECGCGDKECGCGDKECGCGGKDCECGNDCGCGQNLEDYPDDDPDDMDDDDDPDDMDDDMDDRDDPDDDIIDESDEVPDEDNNKPHNFIKGVNKEMNLFSKRELAELAPKFEGYKVLAAGHDETGIHVCLMTNEGLLAKLTVDSLDEYIPLNKVTTFNACTNFAFGENCEIPVDVFEMTEHMNASLVSANAQVEQLNNELAEAKAVITAMTNAENARRLNAAKEKAVSTLNAFNANRVDKVEEKVLEAINADIEAGVYTNSVDENGVWNGDVAIEDRVLAACAKSVMALDKKAVEKNNSEFVWERMSKGNVDDGSVGALLASFGIEE